jgi:hypothetical protein
LRIALLDRDQAFREISKRPGASHPLCQVPPSPSLHQRRVGDCSLKALSCNSFLGPLRPVEVKSTAHPGYILPTPAFPADRISKVPCLSPAPTWLFLP